MGEPNPEQKKTGDYLRKTMLETIEEVNRKAAAGGDQGADAGDGIRRVRSGDSWIESKWLWIMVAIVVLPFIVTNIVISVFELHEWRDAWRAWSPEQTGFLQTLSYLFPWMFGLLVLGILAAPYYFIRYKLRTRTRFQDPNARRTRAKRP